MSETIIKNEPLFNHWCKMVSKEVLSSNMLSVDRMALVLKTCILNDSRTFIECLLDRVESDYLRVKDKLVKVGTSKVRSDKDYTALGLRLSVLKDKVKALRRTKSYIEETHKYILLNRYLKDNGHGVLLDEFIREMKEKELFLNI